MADEPVSALDGPLAHQVMTLLRERFKTSVIALHDVELALEYCTRIVGIQDGQIALDESSEKAHTGRHCATLLTQPAQIPLLCCLRQPSKPA